MSKSVTLDYRIVAGSEVISTSFVRAADVLVDLSVSVAASQTDQQHVLALDVSEIKALYIVSTLDVTLETNDGSTPANTLALKAGEAIVWHSGSTQPCPFTVDVTDVLFTTGAIGTTPAVVRILALTDA